MATYKLIEAKTLGSSAANVEFTSIPSTYTDLLVKAFARSTASANFDVLAFNLNGSTSNRSTIELYGYNGGVGSNPDSTLRIGYISGNSATSNTFGSGELYIPNYTSSNYKSSSADSVSENNSSLAVTGFNANLWSNTAAITSIGIYAINGNLAAGSTFYLYGISNA